MNNYVVGSGPNGLAAAIVLAQAKLPVQLFEAKATIGGGMRSAELTLPGFVHDICSAIHPLAYGSPFFRTLPLEQHGLKWIHPPIAVAHPFDDGTAAILEQSIAATARSLDPDDEKAYYTLLEPLVSNWDKLEAGIMGPLRFPSHPLLMAKFGLLGFQSIVSLTTKKFRGNKAKSFLAGMAAHSMLPLDKPLTAAFGLILAILGHKYGWPFPQGGSQNLANALASILQSLGGTILTEAPINSLEGFDRHRILCDISPKQFAKIAEKQLPSSYVHKLNKYRYGPGVFKIDWALSSPIPWKAAECFRAGTLHLGGSIDEIAESERLVWNNKCSDKPFVLLAQQSLFDNTRAPKDKHTAWGYCHVPNGSSIDMTEKIEAQVERFAPGFKDCILARHTFSAIDLEHYNPNYVGGDINGGVQDICQLFTRPVPRLIPYSTPIKGVYLCSSSTPPGGGVHGMCGYHAAHAALKVSIGFLKS